MLLAADKTSMVEGNWGLRSCSTEAGGACQPNSTHNGEGLGGRVASGGGRASCWLFVIVLKRYNVIPIYFLKQDTVVGGRVRKCLLG